MEKRINYLDGLRGLAIVSVVLFHGFSRWGELEPFHQDAFVRDFFSLGWAGVELFFLISGYVIYMSLTKSPNMISFGVARYLRLAPAMIVCGLVLYAASFYLVEGPSGVANPQDLLPSFTFLDPMVLGKSSGWR